jgi:hypothetical protein
MTKVRPNLSDAEVNHLRKLLGWIDCEIGQSPDEMVETLKKVAPAVGPDVSDEAKLALKAAYDKSAAVPQYVRAAVKALRKTLVKQDGDILDLHSVRTVRHIES